MIYTYDLEALQKAYQALTEIYVIFEKYDLELNVDIYDPNGHEIMINSVPVGTFGYDVDAYTLNQAISETLNRYQQLKEDQTFRESGDQS